MRRALIFKDEFYNEIIDAWGKNIEAAGNNQPKTQADALDKVADEHPEWFEADGYCDPDLLVGNLREEGLKILDLNEEIRRKQQKEQGYEDAT